MMKPKKDVFDRIEQTFVLFKNNFNGIFIPILLYQLVTIAVLLPIFSFIYFRINPIDFGSIAGVDGADMFKSLSWVAPFYGFFAMYMVLWIIYLMVYIWFFLWLIKSIKQAFDWEEVTWKENVFYGFRNILNSFSTYWYIFAYIYLIPALIFIVGGILFLSSSIFRWGVFLSPDDGIDTLGVIGGSLMVISFFVFLIFMIYRWIRAYFSIVSAVDKDTYDKENFDFALKVTYDNWWRVAWNFLLVWVIIMFVSSIISFIPGMIGAIWSNMSSYSEEMSNIDELLVELESLWSFNIFKTISQLLSVAINTIVAVFVMVFAYIFFKRLELENDKSEDKESVEEKEEDLNIEEEVEEGENEIKKEKDEKSDY